MSSEAFLALALTKAFHRRADAGSVIHRIRFASEGTVIRPPQRMGTFEFVKVAALRAAQLARGCSPRVDGDHPTAVFAQREVAEGKVTRNANAEPVGPPV